MGDVSLLNDVIDLAKHAGMAILPYYHKTKHLDVSEKEDKTPLTNADIAAHEAIAAGLQALTPDIPLLSEEGEIPKYEIRSQWQTYWLADPLDGTRGFLHHSPEFSVNIALIKQGVPVLGVIYAPVSDTYYYAEQHAGAFRQQNNDAPVRMHTSQVTDDWRIVLGHYHHSKRVPLMLDFVPSHSLQRLNSSLKFGLVAEGGADLYPRLGPTSEWDSAAGQCILQEAGGLVVDLQGNSLQYNAKAELINPEFLAIGDSSKLEQILNIFQSVRKQP